MKKLLIIAIVFALGVLATQAFAQQPVPQVAGPAHVVRPPVYEVIVPQVIQVRPQPYTVTPVVTPRPPKPLFWTPIRNKLWRMTHKPKVRYYVAPYPY